MKNKKRERMQKYNYENNEMFVMKEL
jgi:hypothetical protein